MGCGFRWSLKKELTVWTAVVVVGIGVLACYLHLQAIEDRQAIARREAMDIQDDIRDRLVARCKQQGVPETIEVRELYAPGEWEGEWTRPEDYTIRLGDHDEYSVETEICCNSSALRVPAVRKEDACIHPWLSMDAKVVEYDYEPDSSSEWWEFWD
ncbi:MAG: hypothetical protein KDB82_16515 [Planctomycetes bacterium]|nr:hypothetical protein [Planctomycetota bacterium]